MVDALIAFVTCVYVLAFAIALRVALRPARRIRRQLPKQGGPRDRTLPSTLEDIRGYLADLEAESAALPGDHPSQVGLMALRDAAERRLAELEREVDAERLRDFGTRWEELER